MVKESTKLEDVIKIAKEYAKVISKHYNVYMIILFGSYAKGINRQDSDIDIAIITDDIKTNKFDEEVNMELLKCEVDYRIEPHIISIEDYKNRETPFVEEVIDNGIKVA